MANYSNVKGFTVQTLSTDTFANAAGGGAWATGNNMLGPAREEMGAAGTQTSALAFGGQKQSSPNRSRAETEYYNGTSWQEQSDLNAARTALNGAGAVHTAALAFGGESSSNLTEKWDGSSWAEDAELNQGRYFGGSFGTSTACIFAGGQYPPTENGNVVEQWNGSSWTEIAEINTGRRNSAAGGVVTSGILFGGRPPDPTGLAIAESWNGASWTETGDMNNTRYLGAGNGTSGTNALMIAGYNPPNNLANTEAWDGATWTEVADLSTAVRANAASQAGSFSESLSFGGFSTAYTLQTEEWTAPAVFSKQVEGQLFFNSTTNTFKETITDIPAGTWASSGNLIQARNILDAQNGTQSSSKASGGSPPGTAGLANVEDYDGTSWSETTEMNTPRYSAAAAGANKDSALVFAGYNNTSPLASPGGYLDATEKWNGSSWTEVNELNIKMSNRSGNGTQTSALCYGGYESPYALTESWDGTNWTEVSDLNTGRMDLGAVGDSNTSALAFGGLVAPNTKSDRVETWDGTSWTEVNELNTNRAYVGGSGSKTLAIAFGGETPPLRANTEAWNGTSWTEIADLSTARKSMGSSGSAAAGLAAGGNDGSTVVTATEEFTAPLANKTITAS